MFGFRQCSVPKTECQSERGINASAQTRLRQRQPASQPASRPAPSSVSSPSSCDVFRETPQRLSIFQPTDSEESQEPVFFSPDNSHLHRRSPERTSVGFLNLRNNIIRPPDTQSSICTRRPLPQLWGIPALHGIQGGQIGFTGINAKALE